MLFRSLLDSVWGSDIYVEARTVDVHIGRLRKALNKSGERDPIRTVRSAGYSFDETFATHARAEGKSNTDVAEQGA